MDWNTALHVTLWALWTNIMNSVDIVYIIYIVDITHESVTS